MQWRSDLSIWAPIVVKGITKRSFEGIDIEENLIRVVYKKSPSQCDVDGDRSVVLMNTSSSENPREILTAPPSPL